MHSSEAFTNFYWFLWSTTCVTLSNLFWLRARIITGIWDYGAQKSAICQSGRAFLWSAMNWKYRNLRATNITACNKYFECCSVHKGIEEAQKRSVIKCHERVFPFPSAFFTNASLSASFAKKPSRLASIHLLFSIKRQIFCYRLSCLYASQLFSRTQNPLCA